MQESQVTVMVWMGTATGSLASLIGVNNLATNRPLLPEREYGRDGYL
jgi:hypothetical protein